MKRLIALLALPIASITLAAPASADGYIDEAEKSYLIAYAATAICPTLDAFPSEAGVFGVMSGIMDNGFSADNAVDIVNAAVWGWCPRHWKMLEEIGARARGEVAPKRVI